MVRLCSVIWHKDRIPQSILLAWRSTNLVALYVQQRKYTSYVWRSYRMQINESVCIKMWKKCRPLRSPLPVDTHKSKEQNVHMAGSWSIKTHNVESQTLTPNLCLTLTLHIPDTYAANLSNILCRHHFLSLKKMLSYTKHILFFPLGFTELLKMSKCSSSTFTDRSTAGGCFLICCV